MGRMKRWLVEGLGAIGTGFTGFVSGFARQVRGCLTRSSSGLTCLSTDLIQLLWLGLAILLLASCLCLEVAIGTGVIVARPVSQGGIDYPDGGFAGGQGGYPMIGDLAELAARTDSIVTYDRRGTIVWMTDFESGLQGSEFGDDDTDSRGRVTATRAYHGAYSLMFDPRGVTDSYVNWGRIIHFLLTGKVGVEIALCTDADPDAVRLEMWYRDGSRALNGLIHYQVTGGIWKIYAKNVGWKAVLEGYQLQQGPGAWHNVKLVIDTETKKYVRLLVDNQVVPLGDYLLKDDPDDDLGQLEFRVTVYGSETQHAAAYIDNVIVTQSEQ